MDGRVSYRLRISHCENRIMLNVVLVLSIIAASFVVFVCVERIILLEDRQLSTRELRTRDLFIKDRYSDLYPKRILFWTPFWSNYSQSWGRIFYKQLSRQCLVNSCEFVYDKRLLDSSDAVVFHSVDFKNSTPLPSSKLSHQVWILFSMEGPAVADTKDTDFNRLNNVINWTMTYRWDSDVVVPYGRITDSEAVVAEIDFMPVLPREANKGSTRELRDYWSEKSSENLAAWMVSHCATHGRREFFVSELAKHMTIDIFGRCGFKKCGKNISIRTVGTFDQEECNQEINKYFFYLAFENSICKDYVTEKFFLALTLDVVPVVFGGADYAAIAPPHSFINALDFPSPKLLAAALINIASDRTKYNRWKQRYVVELGHPFLPMVCDLCAKLNGFPVVNKPRRSSEELTPEGLRIRNKGRSNVTGTYEDMKAWFVDGSYCRRWWSGAQDYMKYKDV